MSDDKLPHFLRVARSIANVRGAALPLAAALTTVVVGVSCGDSVHVCQGFCPMSVGAGPTTSSSGSGGSGGAASGFGGMDGGYGGGPVGDMVMPEGGVDDGGH
jgi:hypothetical protein